MTVGEVSKLLKAHFGSLLIYEKIIRPHGSRAEAHWLVLDAPLTASRYPDLAVVMVLLDKHGFRTVRLPVAMSWHTVARFFQRTSGHSDLQHIALLNRHVTEALTLLLDRAVQDGDDVATASNEGALLWRAQADPGSGPVRLHADTWIGVESAADPALKQAMRAARGEVNVRITTRAAA